MCGDFVEKQLCSFEYNWCRHLSFLVSLKYLFPFIFYLSGGKTYQPALVNQTDMFWDVTPYSLIEIHSSFGRTFCPYHQNGKGGTFSPNLRYSYTELHGVTSHSAISPYSPRSEPQTSQLLSLVHLPLRQNMLSSS